MPERAFYAHSTDRPDKSDWQPLREHLESVATLAAANAAKFGAAEWGRLAGLLHDLGKYSTAFQRRLGGGPKVDHATAGAVEAGKRWVNLSRPLQFVVAGHHAGLANGGEEGERPRTPLEERLHAAVADWSGFQPGIELPSALLPPALMFRKERAAFQLAFFTRMLFACLVDADYLDTEAFYDRVEGRAPRRGPIPSLTELAAALDQYLASKANDSAVGRLRAGILAACRAKAEDVPGLFSLTVPTGGGKTLSSLAFALHHALRHGLERVIYVIPFTSIIEQNAAVFRDVLGEEAVLEHHSAFEERKIEAREAREKLNLAMENWDAPIVVTTAVQLFESLFANKPSRCRKLHNIAKSVVILDEAQSLPLPLLRPCVAALDELARNYGTSVVLCTATQPALAETDDPDRSFKGGLRGVREIVPDPQKLYSTMRRVRVTSLGETDDDAMAARLASHEQVLCIVGTRAHARELYERLGAGDGHFHLSALMCPKHRSQRLDEIRARLKAGARCRVVSTSLIEAGVDVDFPVVYRAEAGIDSIAQAAGRCNREWQREVGDVFVFRPAGQKLQGEMARRADAARSVFRRFADDPLSLPAVEEYFRQVYWSEEAGADDGLDKKQILVSLAERERDLLFPFERIAREFRVIESDMLPVIVPFDDAACNHLRELLFATRVGRLARALQPYVVQLPQRQWAALRAAGSIQPVNPDAFDEQFCELVNTDLYRPDTGLWCDDPTFRSTDTMIC